MIHSRREILSRARKGQVETEWRYYISSHDIGTAQFNLQVRQHWSIENGCHWTLDVTFREDQCRIRVGQGAENFAIIRRMTLNLINQNKTIKASKKSKRNLRRLEYHSPAGVRGSAGTTAGVGGLGVAEFDG